ncbi:MAG: penicillin acylase family protein [Terracidiphilus sp.]
MPQPPLAEFAPNSAANASRPRRKRRWLRHLFLLVGCFLLLLGVALALGVLWLRSVTRAALPQLDGEIHLAGLSAPVTVCRDAHGVPHIDAAGEDDLFVAQGYVTAQDRLWQMDLLRRAPDGELAQVFGSVALQHDKQQRVLRIRLTAERVYSALSDADRKRLDDYARGVNLFISQAESTNSLPPEFRLLLYQPQPWRGVDSISVGLSMVQELDMHAADKFDRARVSSTLHDPQLEADLYPVGSWRDHLPTGIKVDLSQPQPVAPQKHRRQNDDDDDDDDENTQTHLQPGGPAGALIAQEDFRVLTTLLGQAACSGCAAGSNNWVVAGSHTASGKPLLANDMHLELSVPNIWYMADLNAPGHDGAPGFHAAGVTLPGFPFVIAGHNEHVAWGFTALLADVQDLYYEKLDGKGNYEGNDGAWHPLALDHEIIHVRGAKDVVVDVQSTEHGPLMNPILSGEDRPLALKWTLYDPALHAIPLYEMNTASNWAEFSAALENWCWPTQNLVYADDQGHIAYHAIGRVPIRPAGLADVPIRDTSHEWQGYIPSPAMPNAFDPPSGFLATANSRVTTDNSPYVLTDEWMDPYRTERIYKALDGRDRLTPRDMLALQTDIYSEVDQEMGHRFAYAIDHSAGADAQLRKAADLMRSWDGRLTTDSAAASLVTQTRAALWPMILEPRLGKLAGTYHWGESPFAEEEIVMHAKPEWLPKNYKNWDELLAAAVVKGMHDGKAPADVAEWSYGKWHIVELDHPLARFLPLIGRDADEGPLPLSGDKTTVKQVDRAFGPSQRFTMDWSNVDGSTENIVLGESGNPLSPYFRDQWNGWYTGTTLALPFTPPAVAAQITHTLRLLP